MAPKRGNKRGSPTTFGGGVGPLTSPLLMAFPLLQLQVRKAATASYEVWTLPQLGINNFSVSQPFWGFSLGICGLWGAWDSGADLCKLQRSPSYLILPTLPPSQITKYSTGDEEESSVE